MAYRSVSVWRRAATATAAGSGAAAAVSVAIAVSFIGSAPQSDHTLNGLHNIGC